MDINYICSRKRRDFGKPCNFVDVGPVMLTEIDPNPTKKNEYVKLSVVDRAIDNTVKMCAHDVNTITRITANRGMNHKEGGWPASVDNADEESMARFRKNVEKDKHYSNTVKSLGDFMGNFIKENTSIDIYEEYFENERIKRDTKWEFSVKNIFQDLNAPHRSVLDMSWSCSTSEKARKNSTKFAAIYSPKKGKNSMMSSLDSYVWDVENNVEPLYIMKPELPMSVVEFSPFNENLILSGYISGQIALWDIRTNGYAQQLSPVFNSHRNAVTGIKWLKSNQETAFFSGGIDGRLMSWDCRNLSAPTQFIHLDSEKDHFPNLEQDYSITCVEYDLTLPYNFMIGTEQGDVLSFNRKYKQNEDRLRSLYQCGSGPVFNVVRNAFYPQLFLSCNAWSLKIWSEDATDNPILNIVPKDGYYTDADWSPTRGSTVFVTKSNGFLEVFDIPGKIKDPLLNIKLANESLLSVAVAESENHVICGALSGSIHLLNIPEHLRSISESEKDYLRECIKESVEIIGGSPRRERMSAKEKGTETEVDEEWWDPPEKAEVLYDEECEFLKDDKKGKPSPSSVKIENYDDEKGSQEFLEDDDKRVSSPSAVKAKKIDDEKGSQELVKDDANIKTLLPTKEF